MSKIKFDFIGIIESKQQVGKDFIVNVDMEGYHKLIISSQNLHQEVLSNMLILILIILR